MRFEGADGGEVQAGRHTTEADAIVHAFAQASDDEIRGFLCRILKAAGLTAGRSARILGLKRTTYYKCLSGPLPAGMPDPANPGRPDWEEDEEDLDD